MIVAGKRLVIVTAIVQVGLPGQSVFDRPEEVGPADPTLVPGLDQGKTPTPSCSRACVGSARWLERLVER